MAHEITDAVNTETIQNATKVVIRTSDLSISTAAKRVTRFLQEQGYTCSARQVTEIRAEIETDATPEDLEELRSSCRAVIAVFTL